MSHKVYYPNGVRRTLACRVIGLNRYRVPAKSRKISMDEYFWHGSQWTPQEAAKFTRAAVSTLKSSHAGPR